MQKFSSRCARKMQFVSSRCARNMQFFSLRCAPKMQNCSSRCARKLQNVSSRYARKTKNFLRAARAKYNFFLRAASNSSPRESHNPPETRQTRSETLLNQDGRQERMKRSSKNNPRAVQKSRKPSKQPGPKRKLFREIAQDLPTAAQEQAKTQPRLNKPDRKHFRTKTAVKRSQRAVLKTIQDAKRTNCLGSTRRYRFKLYR